MSQTHTNDVTNAHTYDVTQLNTNDVTKLNTNAENIEIKRVAITCPVITSEQKTEIILKPKTNFDLSSQS